MPLYRHALPQLGPQLLLTDGGLETTLMFHDGVSLPDFNAFPLLGSEAGAATLRKYYRAYAEIAQQQRAGLVLESATWRASADWAARLGIGATALAEANRASIQLLEVIRAEFQTDVALIVLSGQIGPRGDGYVADGRMTADAAAAYHAEQAQVFAATEADMLCGMTMNYVEEALGVARAAQGAGMPVVISFTVETDGRLPTWSRWHGVRLGWLRQELVYPRQFPTATAAGSLPSSRSQRSARRDFRLRCASRW